MAERHHRRPGPNRPQGLLWLNFANFAVLTALIAPAYILISGVLAPLGVVPSFDQHDRSFAPALANWGIKAYLFLFVVAALYVFVHRIRYLLMELALPGSKLIFGAITGIPALALAGFAVYVLLSVP